MATPNTERDFTLHSILPAFVPKEPITFEGVTFCTTAQVNAYPLTPASDTIQVLKLASRYRDAYRQRLSQIGLVLLPGRQATTLCQLGIPRIARDIVALCHITGGTAINCHHRNITRICNSDYFEALPVQFRTGGFVVHRPGLRAYSAAPVSISPTLPLYLTSPQPDDFEIDEYLLNACVKAVAAFRRGRRRRVLRQVFRALSLTIHATRILAETGSTYHDLGPRIISWVSAFETLVHPGIGQIGLDQVLELISRIRWHDAGRTPSARLRGRLERCLNHQRYPVRNRKGRVVSYENAACRLYRRLYQIRNDVAHGNAIRPATFAANPNLRRGPRLDELMPLLFRACLLERLREIGTVKSIPSTGSLTVHQVEEVLEATRSAGRSDSALAKIVLHRKPS